jgi:DNA-directed RNA polymerase III subunit RPC6
MASGSSSNGLDVTALKTAIHEACAPTAELDPRHVFYQPDLLALGIIPNNDMNILLTVTQALVNEKLFKVVHSEGLGWRLRSVEEAKKYTSIYHLRL